MISGLGQGAFVTTGDSVVARKDFKVLIVDTSSVHPTSGANGISAAGISETIAAVIMGCWAGD